jgi:hypothetical protein
MHEPSVRVSFAGLPARLVASVFLQAGRLFSSPVLGPVRAKIARALVGRTRIGAIRAPPNLQIRRDFGSNSHACCLIARSDRAVLCFHADAPGTRIEQY